MRVEYRVIYRVRIVKNEVGGGVSNTAGTKKLGSWGITME